MRKSLERLRSARQFVGYHRRRLSHQTRRQTLRLATAIAGEERVEAGRNAYYRAKDRLRAWVHQYVDPDAAYYPWLKRGAKTVLYGGLLLGFYIFMLETNFLWLTGGIPSIEEIKNPKLNQSTEIYTLDGQAIGKFYAENRTPIKFENIPKHLTNALIATEDVRFYDHSGIDTRSVGRAVWGVVTGNNAGGGSTITQQLAKNLFKTRRESRGLLSYVPLVKTIVYKSKEWLMAKKLERNFSKEEILTYYFNTVDFGKNAFGLKTAARTYFNKLPDSLNVQEGAVLVGLQKATTFYNPIRNPENAKRRRNVVLEQMAKYEYLTPAQADSIQKLPLITEFTPENPNAGPATYLKVAVEEQVRKWGEENGVDIYTAGLKIYTTIDSRLQRYAEDAVAEKMKQLQRTFDGHWRGRNPWTDENGNEIPGFIDTVAKRTDRYRALLKRFPNQPDSVDYYFKVKKYEMRVFDWKDGAKKVEMTPYDSIAYYKRFLQAGMMAMDPKSGHIRAWVGGLNYNYFKYDHVKQGKRQPGSTFKPFVYATAIDDSLYDMTPCDRIRDAPFEKAYEEGGEKKVWRPQNSAGSFSYSNMTLRRAMARSINSVTAQLTDKVGPANVARYANRMGIKSQLPAVASIGLGTADVSLYELVAAYCTFVNEGETTEPVLIARIEDRDGNVRAEFQTEHTRALRPESAFLMSYMLQGGLQEPGGTSQNLWSYNLFRNNHQMGGKTGTTSNNSDGWFVGVSDKLVVGAWVGGDDRSIHFRETDLGEGAKTALPLVGRFLEKAYADSRFKNLQGPFPKPSVPIAKEYLGCAPIYDEEVVEDDSTAVDAGDSLFLPPPVEAPEPVIPDSTGGR